MEDTRRQNGQNNHSQNGESRRTKSSGNHQGFEGMNYEVQRGKYEQAENQQQVHEQSGQSAPANMNE